MIIPSHSSTEYIVHILAYFCGLCVLLSYFHSLCSVCMRVCLHVLFALSRATDNREMLFPDLVVDSMVFVFTIRPEKKEREENNKLPKEQITIKPNQHNLHSTIL